MYTYSMTQKAVTKHIAEYKHPYLHVFRDIALIVVSILLAWYIANNFSFDFSGVVQHSFFEGTLLNYILIGLISFVAGIFFTSLFTIAPASFVLGAMSLHAPVPIVALCGAIGAVVGDLILFYFIRDSIVEDISYIVDKKFLSRITAAFRYRMFRWIIPFIGAIIIASPMPDELGLAMMGLSKTNTRTLIAISFCMNFIGVLLVAGVAKLV